MDYFNDVLTIFLGLEHGSYSTLLSMEGQKFRGFHQTYLNLCSEDEQRSSGFVTTKGWVITLQNLNFLGELSLPFMILIISFFWTQCIKCCVHEIILISLYFRKSIIIFKIPWHYNIWIPLEHMILHSLYYFWVTVMTRIKLFLISVSFILFYSLATADKLVDISRPWITISLQEHKREKCSQATHNIYFEALMLPIIDRLVCDVHCFINHKLQLCCWLGESLQAHHAIKDLKQKQKRCSYTSRVGPGFHVFRFAMKNTCKYVWKVRPCSRWGYHWDFKSLD